MKRETMIHSLHAAWRVARDATDGSLRGAPRNLGTRTAREWAFALACATFGERQVHVCPEMASLAAWAWIARARAVTHRVHPSVGRMVAATDLHQLPSAPPHLFSTPWCVEVERPERGERLWETTTALAVYILEGVHYLVVIDGDNLQSVPWRPRWSGSEVAEGMEPQMRSSLLAELGIRSTAITPKRIEWAIQAVRWVTVYALLQEAANAPVRISTSHRTHSAPAIKTMHEVRTELEERDWSESRVTLRPEGERLVAPSPKNVQYADGARARAHLKHQRQIADSVETIWTFVADTAARRWIAPQIQNVYSKE